MALVLEITRGHRQGSRFHAWIGLRIGRKVGELILDDPKISSLHAHIEAGPRGEMVLMDHGSSNGIRVDGQRIKALILKHGVEFQVGGTFFMVIDVADDGERLAIQEVSLPLIENPAPREWQSSLVAWIEENLTEVSDQPQLVKAFAQILVFEFVQGPQLKTRWEMTYGPRSVGTRSLEFPIADLSAPELCFEVISTPDGALFRTKHSDKVRLNDKEVSQAVLSSGDMICVNETCLKVTLQT